MPDLAVQDVKKTIEEIRKKVEANIEEERQLCETDNIESSEISSQDILTALNANEDGDASLFIRLHRDNFVFDHELSRWFKWAGHYWEQDRIENSLAGITAVVDLYEKEAVRQAKIYIQATRDGDKDTAKKAKENEEDLLSRIQSLRSLFRKKNVLVLSSAGSNSLGITSERWDADPWLLGSSNGIIDLKSGNFRDGRPDDFIKTISPTEWQGIDIPAPSWERFLFEIFDENQELVDFMQRLIGYSMIGISAEHILPILWGEGRNGKGTLLEVLSEVFGKIASPIQSEMLLSQGRSKLSSAPSPDILALKGRRLIWGSETDNGRYFDLGKVKWLVGGDTLVGRGLYAKDLIEFKPTHTLFLLTNHKPHAPADEYAFWQRVLLIPFTLSFVDDPQKPNERKKDKDLSQKLLNEKSGILAWCVRGCIEWQTKGLNPPQIVKEATEEYQKEEDILGYFIDDCCKIKSNGEIKAKEFYNAYQRWCNENGHRPVSNTKFGREMSKRYEKGKNDKGSFYRGISNSESVKSAKIVFLLGRT